MIYSERLRLRAVEREDLPLFVTWLNDPEVRAGISLYLPLSQGEEEKWFDTMISLPPPEHAMMIEIHEGENWTAVGDCGFIKIDWRNRSGELGIFIGEKQYWNQGYGGETMRLLLRHGFETLNLHRIYLRVFESNPGAIRCYEKAGFLHEGRMRQAEYQYGQYCDVLLMSVLRPEWKG